MDSPWTSPSFSVDGLSPRRAEGEDSEAGGGAETEIARDGEVKSKLPVGHVDMEVRQRRLQRFYSLPTATTPQGLEAIGEKEEEGEGETGSTSDSEENQL